MCVCVTRWEIAKSFARCLIDSFLCILVVRYDVMYMFVGMRITLEGKLIDDDDLYVCMYVYVLADRYQPAEEQRYWSVFPMRFSSELSKGTKKSDHRPPRSKDIWHSPSVVYNSQDIGSVDCCCNFIDSIEDSLN